MRRPVAAYSVALAALVAAVLLRWLLDPVLGDFLPLVTLFAAVAAAVWVGGYRPALLVATVGYLVCDYLFVEPRGSLAFHFTRNLVGLIAYIVTCAIIIGIGEAMRVAQRRAQERWETLQVTFASIGDAVITTDAGGRITYLNPVAESVTGWRQDEAVGQPLDVVFRIINEQTRQPVENPALRALREGVIVGLANHTTLITKDGTEQPIDDSAAPIQDERGQVSGCVLIFRDITERKQAEQQNAERLATARLLASIVESSEDAIIRISRAGTIESWNAAAQGVFGYTAEQAVGRHISLILPADRADEEDQVLARLQAGEPVVTHFHTVRIRSDGQPIDVSLTISPIRDETGEIIGASKIARDITEEKKSEQHIYRLMTELQEADRRKDEFLATLAHELRGPLAPLSNALEIMKRADGNDDLIQQACNTMERQVVQMVRLVDDLLDVSRITHHKLELRKERVALADVIGQALEICRPLAESSEHEVSVTLPPESIYLYGDPVRLSQAFSNLLNNAYKYTEPRGRIWLTSERQGSDVVVSVKDTGIGIPPGMLPRIFEMFTQVDRALERPHSGLGLGLTLTKQLVELHQGRVEALSDGPGRGSEFVVRLPILVEKPEGHRPPGPTVSEHATPTRRILVVDDNKDSAESLAMLLRMTGNEVQLAYDGLQAVEAAEKLRPDLVLLDIGLPKLNGYDACRRIREQRWGKDMVLVALTGWGQEKDRHKSKDAGFDGHMIKPVSYTDLMKLLASLPSELVGQPTEHGG